MKGNTYQLNFSSHHKILFDSKQREQKANKILSVLTDYLGNLDSLSLLDIGCSTGIMTNVLSARFGKIVGIDIDEEGVSFARWNFTKGNLTFVMSDVLNSPFSDESFDVIACSHIYEHVSDSRKLVSEIHRLLRPGGVCFFAAANKITFKDPEYGIPFLSLLPKFMAHWCVRYLKKSDFYYENFLNFWGLKKLLANFEMLDYTKTVVETPEKFFATEMVRSKSMKQKLVYWSSSTLIGCAQPIFGFS